MNQDQDFNNKTGNFREIGSVESRRQIGKELKTAREALELTYEQVGNSTKINSQFLGEIEKGNWSFLPPGYVKLFVRSYAEQVNIFNEAFDTRLNTLFIGALKPTPVENERSTPVTKNVTIPSVPEWIEQNKSVFLYGALAAVAIIAIAIWISVSNNKKQDDTIVRELNVPVTPLVEVKMDSVATQEVVSEKQVQPQAKPKPMDIAQLEIFSRDTCYIKVEHEDSTLYERTLWPGNRFNEPLPAPIRLTLGNAPGIDLIWNGDTLSPYPTHRRTRVINLNTN